MTWHACCLLGRMLFSCPQVLTWLAGVHFVFSLNLYHGTTIFIRYFVGFCFGLFRPPHSPLIVAPLFEIKSIPPSLSVYHCALLFTPLRGFWRYSLAVSDLADHLHPLPSTPPLLPAAHPADIIGSIPVGAQGMWLFFFCETFVV